MDGRFKQDHTIGTATWISRLYWRHGWAIQTGACNRNNIMDITTLLETWMGDSTRILQYEQQLGYHNFTGDMDGRFKQDHIIGTTSWT